MAEFTHRGMLVRVCLGMAGFSHMGLLVRC